ncbi:MAG: DUF5615 family PIN-like protein [Verrucomicrobiota bacterium]
MKLKIDENLSESVKQVLREQGHDCHSVHDEQIGGGADDRLIEICEIEKRHLLTLDLDFADIIRYPPDKYHGIIVLRLSRQDARYVCDRIEEVLPDLEALELKGHLVIVDDSRVRYR